MKDTATQAGQVRARLQINYIIMLFNFFHCVCKYDHEEEKSHTVC